MKGMVKWFSNEKGYGFITSDVGEIDHYVSVRDIQGAKLLGIGDRVEFSSERGNKNGPRAMQVKILRPKNLEEAEEKRTDLPFRAENTAIIACKVCSNGVSRKAKMCPHCGAPMQVFKDGFIKAGRGCGRIIGGLIGLLLGIWFVAQYMG